MSKEEAKQEFLEDLRSKVPNREVFAVATKPQLEVIANQVLLEVDSKVDNFLEEEDSYNFSMAEIPSDLWFEIVAFLVLTAERTDNPVSERSGATVIHVGNCEIFSWGDKQIFNLEDEAICKKIAQIRQILAIEGPNYDQISTDITIEDLMAYAKSNQPDF